MKNLFFSIAIILIYFITSCQKDNISSNPYMKLNFSTDTMMFDTIFTTIGSSTRHFKVYNRNKYDLNISSIKLAGSSSSPFRINIDGEPTNHAQNIYIRSNDSLYIFVELTVNPTNDNAPLLISDSIVFETNGNIQDVKLLAWGQDVHLLNGIVLTGSNTFTPDKPYLIYDSLYISSGAELIIEAGSRIHSHNGAWIIVDGRLIVNGEFDTPVIFEGDRLEPFYRDKPGQWGGIAFTYNSYNNNINWAIIKNAIAGVNTFPFANFDFHTLTITNTIINNMSYMAIDARGARIDAGNCLFANAKEMCVSLAGGRYTFTHCTITNYWGQYVNRTGPALLLANYFLYRSISGEIILVDNGMEETTFNNSIIYGTRNNEIELVNSYYGQQINASFDYRFENSLIRIDDSFNLSNNNNFINIITDNPKFIDPYNNNFELDTLSPAKDFGAINFALEYPFDLNYNSRLVDDGPDIGSYERKE